jgi:hypothetical protein
MVIVGIVTRGSNVLGEYSLIGEDMTATILKIVARNSTPSTRLVPLDSRFCAVLNKLINGELVSFAAIIESNEERDSCFDFLDAVANFFEREARNPKMTSEMNAFISKQIKQLMEKANSKSQIRDKLVDLNDSMQRTAEVTKNAVSRRD